MRRVIFKDVVKRVNINVDRHNTERLYYVGGEHIDSEELLVTKHGLIKGATIGFKFHFGFNPGHILFMSRNPHLRKASMATFEGICSDSTYVVETRDKNILLQEYLLLEMQSDRFWNWAEANKSGGVNYLINYKTLDTYEFNLPSIEEQKFLTEKLWVAYEVKQSYLKMIDATDEMIKAQFIELFGSPSINNKGWKIAEMKSVCPYISDGSHYSPPDDFESDIPMLSVKDMTDNGFSYNDCKHLSCDEYEKLRANGCKPLKDDVLVAKDGSYFKYIFPLIEEKDQAILSSIAILRPNKEILNPRFLCEYLKSEEVIDIVERHYLTGTAIHRVILKGFKDMKIYLPPIQLQHDFEMIYKQADKSKAELRKSIDAIDKVIESLINENL